MRNSLVSITVIIFTAGSSTHNSICQSIKWIFLAMNQWFNIIIKLQCKFLKSIWFDHMIWLPRLEWQSNLWLSSQCLRSRWNHHNTHTHAVNPVPFFHTRMGEGSNCSDADNSLKRSQRAWPPNKFCGYTSDDENMPGTPFVIGTRTFKPQPPPQLTWKKEKKLLPRTHKVPSGQKGQAKKCSLQTNNGEDASKKGTHYLSFSLDSNVYCTKKKQ